MALDKLGIYNDALLLLGQRALASITEEREPRYLLDSVYDFGAIDYCLELVKPVFARKTVSNTSIVQGVGQDLLWQHNHPADLISVLSVYSDSQLDQEIKRFINEKRQIHTNYETIFLRYISTDDAEVYASWNPSFARVVSAYLAKEIVLRIDPDELESATATFNGRVESALSLEKSKEPEFRPNEATTTLTDAWRNIYNDALLIMGLSKIVSNDDDSNNRSVLDTALDADLVSCLLEDTAWTWAITTQQITYNPSLNPDWGYKYAFDKPSDIHRLDGVFYDEYMRNPLKHYSDEQDTIYTDNQVMYLKYVSSDFLVNPSSWPSYFKKLVASRLAQESYMVIAPDKMKRVEEEFKVRDRRAKSVDTMQSPPRLLAQGNWLRSRGIGNSRRRRP